MPFSTEATAHPLIVPSDEILFTGTSIPVKAPNARDIFVSVVKSELEQAITQSKKIHLALPGLDKGWQLEEIAQVYAEAYLSLSHDDQSRLDLHLALERDNDTHNSFRDFFSTEISKYALSQEVLKQFLADTETKTGSAPSIDSISKDSQAEVLKAINIILASPACQIEMSRLNDILRNPNQRGSTGEKSRELVAALRLVSQALKIDEHNEIHLDLPSPPTKFYQSADLLEEQLFQAPPLDDGLHKTFGQDNSPDSKYLLTRHDLACALRGMMVNAPDKAAQLSKIKILDNLDTSLTLATAEYINSGFTEPCELITNNGHGHWIRLQLQANADGSIKVSHFDSKGDDADKTKKNFYNGQIKDALVAAGFHQGQINIEMKFSGHQPEGDDYTCGYHVLADIAQEHGIPSVETDLRADQDARTDKLKRWAFKQVTGFSATTKQELEQELEQQRREQAAIIIQKHFRGHAIRNPKQATPQEKTPEEAAIAIQKIFRGHKARRSFQAKLEAARQARKEAEEQAATTQQHQQEEEKKPKPKPKRMDEDKENRAPKKKTDTELSQASHKARKVFEPDHKAWMTSFGRSLGFQTSFNAAQQQLLLTFPSQANPLNSGKAPQKSATLQVTPQKICVQNTSELPQSAKEQLADKMVKLFIAQTLQLKEDQALPSKEKLAGLKISIGGVGGKNEAFKQLVRQKLKEYHVTIKPKPSSKHKQTPVKPTGSEEETPPLTRPIR